MTIYTFVREQWLPRPRAEVFPFFADAANLENITPPWMGFKTLTPGPIEMKPGTLIEYQIKLHGIPLHWKTEISMWDPPRGFVDTQLSGPYRRWVHTHTFEEQKGGTLCRDHVDYAVPGGALINRFLVHPELEKIFAYRQKVIASRFPPLPAGASR